MDGPHRDTLTGAVGGVRQCDQHVRESLDIDVHRSAARIVFCNAGSMNLSNGVQWHSMWPGACGCFPMIQKRRISFYAIEKLIGE
jgi:hypothetical protein